MAEQAGLSITWSQTLKTGDEAHFLLVTLSSGWFVAPVFMSPHFSVGRHIVSSAEQCSGRTVVLPLALALAFAFALAAASTNVKVLSF